MGNTDFTDRKDCIVINTDIEEDPEAYCDMIIAQRIGSEKVYKQSIKEAHLSKEPFAGFSDFDDCVSKNQDKDDPEAFCAVIKRKVEGEKMKTSVITGERVKKVMNKAREAVGKLPLGVINNLKRVGAVEAKVESLQEKTKRREGIQVDAEVENKISRGWTDTEIVDYIIGKFGVNEEDRNRLKGIVKTKRNKRKGLPPQGKGNVKESRSAQGGPGSGRKGHTTPRDLPTSPRGLNDALEGAKTEKEVDDLVKQVLKLRDQGKIDDKEVKFLFGTAGRKVPENKI